MTILYDTETGAMCNTTEAAAYLAVCRSPDRYIYVETPDTDCSDISIEGVEVQTDDQLNHQSFNTSLLSIWLAVLSHLGD